MIPRLLYRSITKNLFRKKAILILGPRQSGKTTLVRQLADDFKDNILWLNADEPDVRELLTNRTSSYLKNMAGNSKLVIIDEAQRVPNIGLTLKLFTDNLPGIQVIATGSSSFELSDKIKEPLTGRKFEYHLFPLSVEELTLYSNPVEEKRLLEQRLVYGFYPEVVTNAGSEKKILLSISDSVLYKDLFALEKVKKPAQMEKLLKALALQAGNEVSFNELSQVIGADKETVERYIYLLEQAFVIFRLPAFSRNIRNELKRSRKIYFYDNGIRNSLLANFTPPELRTDKGSLWENFLVSERMKFLHYHQFYCNRYFWRTAQQQEIDYIEEKDGVLHAFEFKYKKGVKAKIPKTFAVAYPDHTFKVVDSENYLDFIC